jgi:cation-transporting ATPase E
VIGEHPPGDARVLGLVVLAEQLRPGIRETIAFLQREGVEVKVLSGDATVTVAAIARDVGIPVSGMSTGDELPGDETALAEFAAGVSFVGRISPEGKRAIVQALGEQGRYVAMASTTCPRLSVRGLRSRRAAARRWRAASPTWC